MANTTYDVVVIGAGPGGYVCAIRASQLGLKTAIIDREFLGGVCLNVGCIPSKSLLKNADLAHTLRHKAKEFGVSFDNLQLDYAAAVKRSREVSSKLTKGVQYLLKKNKVAVYMGNAVLSDTNNIQITAADGQTQNITGKNIVLATGASAIKPAAFKVDGQRVLTYWEAILQESRPASAVVIGSGAIGVEFSTIWNAYGTKVTIVEMLPRIVPREDEEISKELAKAFVKDGIQLLTGTKVEQIDSSDPNLVRVTVSNEKGQQVLEAEQVLVAIGFTANSKNLGLDKAGVRVSERGFVEIDDAMRTNVPGIYAIGDLTGKAMLAHVASAMGIICAENIAGQHTHTLNYKMMPAATYCHPEIASFGYTEADAKAAGYDVKIARFNFQANGKALGLGEGSGWVKLVTDAKYGEILGAHLIGPSVTELLPELTLAQQLELTGAELARNVHAHPTLSEVLMEAAHGLDGDYIHQ
jgi:dihydrolipoamide dehydrogenase